MGVTLTKREVQVLRVLRQLELERVVLTYQMLCHRLDLKSVGTAFQFMEQLERKGYVKAGTRLALVECPVVSSAGRRVLGRAA